MASNLFEDFRNNLVQWANVFATTSPSDISNSEIMSLEGELQNLYYLAKEEQWQQRDLIREAYVIASYLSNNVKSRERDEFQLDFFDQTVVLGDLLDLLQDS